MLLKAEFVVCLSQADDQNQTLGLLHFGSNQGKISEYCIYM